MYICICFWKRDGHIDEQTAPTLLHKPSLLCLSLSCLPQQSRSICGCVFCASEISKNNNSEHKNVPTYICMYICMHNNTCGMKKHRRSISPSKLTVHRKHDCSCFLCSPIVVAHLRGVREWGWAGGEGEVDRWASGLLLGSLNAWRRLALRFNFRALQNGNRVLTVYVVYDKPVLLAFLMP